MDRKHLPELIGRFGAELLGKANYARFGQEFPLLVKFIDAREDLSIQVHPDDELARKRHGKAENARCGTCWKQNRALRY